MELTLHSIWMGVTLAQWAFEIKPHDEVADKTKKIGRSWKIYLRWDYYVCLFLLMKHLKTDIKAL